MAVVGAGGLGCPALLSLAAAGVGRLTIIDDDVVEASNLARQTLYRMADIGAPKVEVATRALAGMGAQIVHRRIRLTADNAAQLFGTADVVLDTTDQWATRFAVADAAARLGIPLVWGSALGWDGLLTVFAPTGPGIDALVDRHAVLAATNQPNCATAGVFGPLTAEVGAAMAGEALRIVTGAGSALIGTVRSWDARHGRVREIPLAAQPVTEPASTASSSSAQAGNQQTGSEPARTVPEQLTDAPAPPRLRDRVTVDEVPATAFILDVRPAGHPDLTLNLAYSHTALERLEDAIMTGTLDLPDTPIVVACALGPRARAAAELLRSAGVENVSTLDGGVAALAAFAV